MRKKICIILATMIAAVSCQEKVYTDLNVQHEQDNLETKSLKVISYNILEGMKLDAANGYENFIQWVKGQDPDILAIEEANGFTEEKLKEVAKKWGHDHVVTNCGYPGASSFPVALTSRYEIKDVKHLVENVYHGAIWANICGIEVIVLHLYPFSDIRSNIDWDKPSDIDGDGDIDGDDYRIHEIDVYIGETIMKNPLRPNWLMMGDFNSVSPLDRNQYKNKPSYDVHGHVLELYTDLVMSMHNKFCRSLPTIYGGWNEQSSTGKRYDFIYGSDVLSRDLLRADFIHDDFTENNSDHYPIAVELRTYEN